MANECLSLFICLSLLIHIQHQLLVDFGWFQAPCVPFLQGTYSWQALATPRGSGLRDVGLRQSDALHAVGAAGILGASEGKTPY